VPSEFPDIGFNFIDYLVAMNDCRSIDRDLAEILYEELWNFYPAWNPGTAVILPTSFYTNR